MKILTQKIPPYDLDTVPEEIDDLRYCALDASDPDDIDFYFCPNFFRKFLCTSNMFADRRL